MLTRGHGHTHALSLCAAARPLPQGEGMSTDGPSPAGAAPTTALSLPDLPEAAFDVVLTHCSLRTALALRLASRDCASRAARRVRTLTLSPRLRLTPFAPSASVTHLRLACADSVIGVGWLAAAMQLPGWSNVRSISWVAGTFRPEAVPLLAAACPQLEAWQLGDLNSNARLIAGVDALALCCGSRLQSLSLQPSEASAACRRLSILLLHLPGLRQLEAAASRARCACM